MTQAASYPSMRRSRDTPVSCVASRCARAAWGGSVSRCSLRAAISRARCEPSTPRISWKAGSLGQPPFSVSKKLVDLGIANPVVLLGVEHGNEHVQVGKQLHEAGTCPTVRW